ncbi:spore coat protein [Neobacillus bataviensis LMG 21833]|uniref:Spore coat protein n=1 Tax=Neobacillus bataviensis LMG 21833 TaxID=1117379 RepID=K6DM44_9BACI|nr:CotH kinase family protein [Neobacillus bataviensis]EKN69243.1 spore coat protein [Neobacillus bataviensis LMG 21833]
MKQKNKSGLLLLALAITLTGCSFPLGASDTVKSANSAKEPKQSINAEPRVDQLMEDRRVYDNDKMDSVIDLYVTVLNNESNDTFYTINHWYDNGGKGDPPKLNAIVQEGSPSGPQKGDWGYGTDIPNSVIKIRGNSSRFVPQKSYQLKLAESAGLWHGQTVINLNKHQYDVTRVRQKLSFDLFREIPDFTSLRTQFVHLHVKDLSGQTPDQQFIDYGLFTQVEQPNKRFLYAHGLDPNGNLYKANFFEFQRYPDQLKLATDPSYNKEEFESILQIKGSEDHDKLLKMLDAVNNYKLNINDVIDQYFNRENYITWLAVNLLLGNMDTDAQNFYLYNPLNSEKFYFLPWDYDAAWGQQAEENERIKGFTAKWQLGISNYWGAVLHQRFFKDPKNIDDLNKKIEVVSKILNKQKIQEYVDQYYPIASSYIKTSPDLQGLPYKIEDLDKSFKNLINVPEQNKEFYYASLENPMPIYLGDLVQKDDSYEFTWDPSYDFQADDLTYDFQVSQSADFSSVYIEQKDLTNTTLKVEANQLKQGKNYWRVTVKDSKGNTQIAFDRLKGEDDSWHNGEREFYVK